MGAVSGGKGHLPLSLIYLLIYLIPYPLPYQNFYLFQLQSLFFKNFICFQIHIQKLKMSMLVKGQKVEEDQRRD